MYEKVFFFWYSFLIEYIINIKSKVCRKTKEDEIINPSLNQAKLFKKLKYLDYVLLLPNRIMNY